jgi:hypothetical protein
MPDVDMLIRTSAFGEKRIAKCMRMCELFPGSSTLCFARFNTCSLIPGSAMMKKVILLAILVTLSWKGYEKYGHKPSQRAAAPEHAFSTEAEVSDTSSIDITSAGQSTFACDGRVYCSQMKSCDEAKYFLEHCPNVKMDGNHDGIPCEKQWCS